MTDFLLCHAGSGQSTAFDIETRNDILRDQCMQYGLGNETLHLRHLVLGSSNGTQTVVQFKPNCHHARILHDYKAGARYQVPTAFLMPLQRDMVQYSLMPDLCPLVRDIIFQQRRCSDGPSLCKSVIERLLQCSEPRGTMCTKHAWNAIMSPAEQHDHKGIYACIVCMHGSLLGLFDPKDQDTCSREPHHGSLCMFSTLLQILTSSRATHMCFAQQNWFLLQLCVYELVVQCIEDYLPVEAEIIQKHMPYYPMIVQQIRSATQKIRGYLGSCQGTPDLMYMNATSRELIHTLHYTPIKTQRSHAKLKKANNKRLNDTIQAHDSITVLHGSVPLPLHNSFYSSVYSRCVSSSYLV